MSGYAMFINDTQMPITPGKLQLKIKGNNKTLTLVNDGEINFLKQPGLTEITMDVLLPMYPGYPFAVYPEGFKTPDYYADIFKKLITERKTAYFKLVRYSPDNRRLFDNEMLVSVENYTITEDAANGPDVTVSLTLKQYIVYATKILHDDGIIIQQRETFNAPTPQADTSAPKYRTYTVVKGDCLWSIAKKYYGNGAQYKKIYEANKDKIKNPNLINVGQVLTIP